MQEMSPLLQKENEPKQKKNHQAPGLPVHTLQHSGGGAPSFQLAPLPRCLEMGGGESSGREGGMWEFMCPGCLPSALWRGPSQMPVGET